MTKGELTKILNHLDGMRERVGRILGKKPLELDTSTGQKPLRSKPVDYGHGRETVRPRLVHEKPTFAHDYPPPIACGELKGHEMRVRHEEREERAPDGYDSDPMWAQFERDFDNMMAVDRITRGS